MPSFSMLCLRKHLLSDKQYNLKITQDIITISHKTQCPKYKYIINTALTVDWKVSHDETNQLTIQAVGFIFSSKTKWFYAAHDDLYKLKLVLQPNVIQKGLGNFYTPLQILGTGASSQVTVHFRLSQVFLASDLITQNLLAVKRITGEKGRNSQSIINSESVQNELNGLKINSPYITNLVEVYSLENHCFIVLELLKGGNLEGQLNQPIPENIARRILKQILIGIQDLNEYNLVHKDIQPQNIMLTENGDIKLIDFGSCSQVDQKNNINLGTPGYCAPEMFDQNKKITYTADIFSAGCLFYKMLKGSNLFSGQSTDEIIMKNKLCQIDLSGLNISNKGMELLRMMLIKDPQNRLTAKECLNHVYFLFDTLESIATFKSSFSNIPDDLSINNKVPLMNGVKFKIDEIHV